MNEAERPQPRPVARRWIALAVALLVIGAAAAALAALRPDAARSSVARGAGLYQANCASCHGGPTGGGMMDYPPKHNANGHTWHHPDCELIEVIKEGGGPMTEMMRRMMAPPDAPKMVAFKDKLTDEEIGSILDHIKSWWTPDQRRLQEQVTRQQCG